LKRCKTKIIIRTDFCGGIENLNNNIQIGDVIIPKIAYCGDGTSPQYIMKYAELSSQLESIPNPISKMQPLITGHNTIFISKPNEELNDLMFNESKSLFPSQAKEVDIWTTDALFCETYDFINALSSINIEAIDMESSILFLLGKLYNLKTISLLSISDLPGNSKYDIFSSNEIHPDMEKGIDNAIKVLMNSLPKIKPLLI
jgi:purine-nucleoside phosphorylase